MLYCRAQSQVNLLAGVLQRLGREPDILLHGAVLLSVVAECLPGTQSIQRGGRGYW